MAVFSPVEPLLRACAHTQLEAAQFSIKTGNTTTFLPNKIEKKRVIFTSSQEEGSMFRIY